MTNVPQALSIVRRVAPDLSRYGAALVIAIAGLESSLGEGFLPNHNWGAETAGSKWTGATFEHADSRWTPEGVVNYTTLFRDYPDDDAAALGLVSLLRAQYGKALAAADRGDWLGASRALYDAGYYKGVKPRAGAIADHYRAVSKWLNAQGIDPRVVGGALILEPLLWLSLGVFAWRAARKAR